MTFYLTEFDNGSIQPRGQSALLPFDPTCYMGKPTLDVGNVKIWKSGTLRILLTTMSLTDNFNASIKTGT